MNAFRQIFRLLTRDQRRSALWLFLLMLIGMTLETFGVGLVVPLLTLLTSPDLSNYPKLTPLLDSIGQPSRERLIVAGMLILVGIYAAKAFFLAWLAWVESRFAFGVQASLSQRLFTGYLRQPWTFHLQRNSAQLIRNATGEIGQFTSNALNPALLLLGECLVVAGIGALLIVMQPVGALLVGGVLGAAAWIFQRVTRRYLLRWGRARQYHEGLRIQHLQQGLGGAKDVKLLGREAEFFDQFQTHNLGSTRASQRQNALKQLPRLWLELLAVIGLATLVLVVLGQGEPVEALLPTLGLFAAGAFRLMPSANRILTAAQSLRYGTPVVQNLSAEFASIEDTRLPQRGSPMSFDGYLELEGVCFQYPNSESRALDDVHMTIQRGTSVGFVGRSGSGKSTLVDVILGLLTPSSGKVTVDGVDIQGNLRGWQDQIGYVPQTIYLTDDTLRRNVAFGLPEGLIDDAAVNKAIRAAQLEDFVGELPQGLNTLVGERGIRLSGGQRQRIGIARALYHDPPVLVLDEATSSLDVATEKEVMEAIKSLHGTKTMLIVAHRFSAVEHCLPIYKMERGSSQELDGIEGRARGEYESSNS